MNLQKGNLKEAWRKLKGWYSAVEEKAPKPCRLLTKNQTAEREALYRKMVPPGDPIPINTKPFTINDVTSTDAELRIVVKNKRNGRADDVSGIKADHMKHLLRDAMQEEEKGTKGLGKHWQVFVQLIHTIWDRDKIPQQMSWMTVILILKGGKDH